MLVKTMYARPDNKRFDVFSYFRNESRKNLLQYSDKENIE
jgi:hypothetical protein